MIKHLLRSAGAITAGQAISILGSIALVPLYLAHWSQVTYGEWMALSSLVAYVGTLDMGVNNAASNALLKAYARDDLSAYRKFQASALAFYIVLASAVTLIVAGICWALPVSHWLGVTHIPQSAGALILCILAARLMWQMPAFQIWGIFRTTGDQATTQWLWNLQLLGGIVGTWCVLAFGGGPVHVAAATFVAFLAVAFSSWLAVQRFHPALVPQMSSASYSEIRFLLKPSMYFGLMMVGTALTLNGPVVVVSKGLGGAAVALMVTTRTLANVIRQAQGVLTTAIWPHLTRMDARGERKSLRAAHRFLIAFSITISVGAAAAMWYEGPSVIALWTRGRIVCDGTLLRVFLVATVLQGIWFASSMIATATNRHEGLGKSYVAAAILNVAATVALLNRLGPTAAPVGMLIGEGVACYHFVIKGSCGDLGEAYFPFARQLWGSLLVSSALAGLAGWAVHRHPLGPPALTWAAAGLCTTTVAGATVWCTFLDGPSKLILLAKLRSIRH